MACVLAGPAAGTGGSGLPSGQTVELYEVLVDHVGAEHWIRFRFLAPQIARDTGQLGFAEVEPDMTYLCATVALPYLDEFDLAGEVVVISLADRAVDFGQSDPDATQYIDAFRVENGICIWEGY
ncbi:hypothetical protein FDT80_16840 [Sulfitobacter sabulilitoris]|uniref:Acetolactate synthase n=1 Tax=Sulfitobacter sabulilitoris TaxID=2562655 RepID=A0A5S3PBS2_9RHOB|nr:hypothetical protein FDT80_16840 [Sulfitobacter sabulilitoris]